MLFERRPDSWLVQTSYFMCGERERGRGIPTTNLDEQTYMIKDLEYITSQITIIPIRKVGEGGDGSRTCFF